MKSIVQALLLGFFGYWSRTAELVLCMVFALVAGTSERLSFGRSDGQIPIFLLFPYGLAADDAFRI